MADLKSVDSWQNSLEKINQYFSVILGLTIFLASFLALIVDHSILYKNLFGLKGYFWFMGCSLAALYFLFSAFRSKYQISGVLGRKNLLKKEKTNGLIVLAISIYPLLIAISIIDSLLQKILFITLSLLGLTIGLIAIIDVNLVEYLKHN